jgi:superfamily II DNA/RNA helicase
LPYLLYINTYRRIIKKKAKTSALVVTPTREQVQIGQSFDTYGNTLTYPTYHFGGVSQNPQVDALRNGVDIATRKIEIYTNKVLSI